MRTGQFYRFIVGYLRKPQKSGGSSLNFRFSTPERSGTVRLGQPVELNELPSHLRIFTSSIYFVTITCCETISEKCYTVYRQGWLVIFRHPILSR